MALAGCMQQLGLMPLALPSSLAVQDEGAAVSPIRSTSIEQQISQDDAWEVANHVLRCFDKLDVAL